MDKKITKTKIKKGDKVLVIVGKDKGKKGKVERIISDKGKIIVSKINILKKHMKPSSKNQQGGIIEFPAPFDISNVTIVCPKCNKPTRISYKILKNNSGNFKKAINKIRICQKCKEGI